MSIVFLTSHPTPRISPSYCSRRVRIPRHKFLPCNQIMNRHVKIRRKDEQHLCIRTSLPRFVIRKCFAADRRFCLRHCRHRLWYPERLFLHRWSPDRCRRTCFNRERRKTGARSRSPHGDGYSSVGAWNHRRCFFRNRILHLRYLRTLCNRHGGFVKFVDVSRKIGSDSGIIRE